MVHVSEAFCVSTSNASNSRWTELTCTEGGADHLDAGSGALREFAGPLAEHKHT